METSLGTRKASDMPNAGEPSAMHAESSAQQAESKLQELKVSDTLFVELHSDTIIAVE